MARNQKLSYEINMFHFLTKQNYSKYSQISRSMSFSSSEASTIFRSSTASSTSKSVIFSKGLSLFLSSRTDKTKSRSHCKILDRELNYMKTKYSHFEIEHELSEECIVMPYVTSSKWTESAVVTDLPELLKNINFVFILRLVWAVIPVL